MRKLTQHLLLMIAGVIGGVAMMWGIDRPHHVSSSEFRVLADTIEGAIRIEGLYISRSRPEMRGTNIAFLSGHDDTFVGECAGDGITIGSNDLLLGDRTGVPAPDTSNFVNIANKVCWLRDSGVRADCPPPASKCPSAH